ncbi:MAG: (Fe-S)-binding protein [Nitrospirota bacterium]|nr:(Fe-S)-binding protein [Nitrospirota bacterium]
MKCGACSAVCPSFRQDRRESQSPRGRIALIEAVLDGRLAVSDLYQDRLATCAGCMACEGQCASGVPVTSIILAAKEQAVQESGAGIVQSVLAGALRHEAVMRSLSWLAPVALHFSKGSVAGGGAGQGSRKIRNADYGMRNGSGQQVAARKKVIFYPGCAIRHFQQDIQQSTAAVLEHLGYHVVIPDDLKCCGRPFLSLGDRDGARNLAEQNTRVLAALDAEAVVTACASCGMTFKRDYPELLSRSGIRPAAVMDIHEFLADKLAASDLSTPLHGRITWHDPCHLGRGQGLAKTARSVVRRIPGVMLVEMDRPDQCCGFGGLMRAVHPALSRGIGRSKARDIIATGAATVLTGCPGCRMQIADSLRLEGAEVAVMHTVQVIEAALRSAECGVQSAEDREIEKVRN